MHVRVCAPKGVLCFWLQTGDDTNSVVVQSVCVCVVLWLCTRVRVRSRARTHTGSPGRFLAPSTALLKKIYSRVSPDDKLLAAEQILCSDVFTLQRVNSNSGSFGRSRRKRRRVHVRNKGGVR